MFLRRFSNKSGKQEIKGFHVVHDRDKIPEGVELTDITIDPQIVEYAGIQYCGCRKKHRGLAEGVVQICVDSHGRLHVDWGGVEDPRFPCETDA